MRKIAMTEPQWGYDFLKLLVDLGEKYQRIQAFYPIWADIFVFVYPIFLTAWYLKGIIKRQREAKQEAMFIFFACFLSVAFNILSQQFFDKARPIHTFGTGEGYIETPLHGFLPATSFPSDHAVVTFSIATATLLIALRHHNKKLKIWSVLLFVFAVITGICRIGTTVHWTTDILAGTVVGILVPIFLMLPVPYRLLSEWVIAPLISVEEWIMERLGWKSEK